MSLNLNTNHLMTIGAVIFAGFAVYEFTKKPGGALSSQPAQQQRDSALTTWLLQAGSMGQQSFTAQVQSQQTLDNMFAGI